MGDALLLTLSRDFIVNLVPGFCFHLMGTAYPLAGCRVVLFQVFKFLALLKSERERCVWGWGMETGKDSRKQVVLPLHRLVHFQS